MWMKLEVTQAEPAEQFSRPLLAADAGVQVFFFFFFWSARGKAAVKPWLPAPCRAGGPGAPTNLCGSLHSLEFSLKV